LGEVLSWAEVEVPRHADEQVVVVVGRMIVVDIETVGIEIADVDPIAIRVMIAWFHPSSPKDLSFTAKAYMLFPSEYNLGAAVKHLR